jgi:uncharacterized protein
MLTKNLLRYRMESGSIRPLFLDSRTTRILDSAQGLIRIFERHLGRTKGELDEAIKQYTAAQTGFRVLQGFAKILMGFAEFEERTPTAQSLRAEIFERAAKAWPVVRLKSLPHEIDRRMILSAFAEDRGLPPERIENDFYADLPERRRLAHLKFSGDAEDLIARYNLELARGLLYWAERISVDLEDSYQDVFRYIKLCRLMHVITRRDRGYHLELDGPSSLLQGTTRYGLKMAIFLPALALCQSWRMEASIVKKGKRYLYSLDHRERLVSHFRRFPMYDSRLERDFAMDFEKSFQRQAHNWRLDRADAVLSLSRNEVMIPDFTLRNSAGREVYLEIVGFWTPEYLRKKIGKAKAANLTNLVLAVSNRLALGDDSKDLNVLWFAGKLQVAPLLAYVNGLT